MRWRDYFLMWVIGFATAAVSLAVHDRVINHDQSDVSPHYTCDAAMANAYGPNGWQISCVHEDGDSWVQFNFDHPLPPEADDKVVVHVPGYSPECAAEFAAYWRAEPDADSATHNAGLKRVKEACDGWPWPVLDALLYRENNS